MGGSGPGRTISQAVRNAALERAEEGRLWRGVWREGRGSFEDRKELQSFMLMGRVCQNGGKLDLEESPCPKEGKANRVLRRSWEGAGGGGSSCRWAGGWS